MAEVVRTYYDNGKLKSEVYMINGKKNGIYKDYYINGQLDIICSYIDDKRIGELKGYYKDGQLEIICSYIDGKKNGEYKYYYISGNLQRKYNNVDGKMIKRKNGLVYIEGSPILRGEIMIHKKQILDKLKIASPSNVFLDLR